MRLDNIITIIIVALALMLKASANDVPFLNEARSNTIRPSVFIVEEREGSSAPLSSWIKTTTKQYYIEACNLLKKEIAERKASGVAADQIEHTLALYESDSKNGLIPRWVENIFITSRDAEVMVSFFARSGGWTETNTGALASCYNPAYILRIDPKTGGIMEIKDKPRAAVYVNLYKSLADDGIVTDYAQKPGVTTPLNRSQAEAKPKASDESE